MFLSNFCRNFVKPFTVPELIVKRFPFYLQKFEYPKQVKKSDDFPNENVIAALDFPYRTFKFFNNSDLKMIFNEFHQKYASFDKTNTTDLYNCLLRNYIKFNIDFNANEILEKMVNNNVNMNKNIISILIRKYNQENNLKAATQLVEKCEENKTPLINQSYLHLYLLYFREGLDEEAAKVVEKYNIDINTPFIIKEKASIYMLTNQIDKMNETLKELQTNGYFNHIISLFERGAESYQPDELLKEILAYASSPRAYFVQNGITNLNRNDFYNQAFLLLKTYSTLLQKANNNFILQSFNYSKCPLDIYQSVIKLLYSIDKLNKAPAWFTGFRFDDSFFMAKQLLESEVPQFQIYSNLLMKCLQEYNEKHIGKCLEFGFNELELKEANSAILNKLPSMLKIYESYDKLLTCLKPYQSVLFPICLLNLLLEGKTNKFVDLRTKYPIDVAKMTISKFSVVKIFNENNKIQYLDTFVKYSNTVFSKAFTTTICRYVLNYALLTPDNNDIDFAIEFIKKHNIENDKGIYQRAMKNNPQHESKIEELYEIENQKEKSD